MAKQVQRTRSKYKLDWNEDDRFKDWIKPVGCDSNKFMCKCCEKEISLSNMYEARVIEHSKCPSHVEKLETWKKHNARSKMFFTAARPVTKVTPAADAQTVTGTESESVQKEIGNLVSTNTRAKVAEIKWIFNGIRKGYSNRDFDHDNKLLKHMFQEDPLSEIFSCGRTKAYYVQVYRLDPYICREIDKLVQTHPSLVYQWMGPTTSPHNLSRWTM